MEITGIGWRVSVKKLEDTHHGWLLANSPTERARHDAIVNGLRKEARPIIEAELRGDRCHPRGPEYFQ